MIGQRQPTETLRKETGYSSTQLYNIITLVENFPLGDTAKSFKELDNKIAVASYCAGYDDPSARKLSHDELSEEVKELLCKVCQANPEDIPSVEQAVRNLKITMDSIKDYSKLESVLETKGYTELMALLNSNLTKKQVQRNSGSHEF